MGHSRRKGLIKIRAETDEKEIKETIAKINKTKSWFFEKINNKVSKSQLWRGLLIRPFTMAKQSKETIHMTWRYFGFNSRPRQ